MKHVILCVDDELDNVEALERLFRQKYLVLKATSGAEGLEQLAKHPEVALILSDQRMPHMSGVEFLAASQSFCPNAMRILLTGYTDIESVVAAINSGQVYRYITKPWDPVDLTNTVDKAIERFQLGRELKIALDELKVLDEAKNHFMILINHELKTPLTALISFHSLLKETQLSPEQTKFVFRMGEAINRLHALVSDVLELVSAETGVLKVSPTRVPARSLLKGLEVSFLEPAKYKNQTLVVDGGDDLVLADHQVIQKVLGRLVDNAIKFGNPSSEIRVQARPSVDKTMTEFSVRNQGRPIEPSVISKILKPFALDEEIMHHSKGTGLGLSLSQALLKTSGSALNFKSDGDTVEVSFRLPSA